MGLVLGGLSTAALQAEEVMELQQHCYFTQSEIRRLYARFRKLDTKKTGGITRAELLKIPELSMNPLAQRVISLFRPPRGEEPSRDGSNINFRDFLRMLSVFSERATREEKERLAFRVYDINGDGFITDNELFEVLKTMAGDNVSDAQLWDIVRETIATADADGDGKLSFTEFQAVMAEEDVVGKMVIQYSDADLRI